MLQTFTNNKTEGLKAQDWIALLACLLMTSGMVCSRLLLSIGMILLLLNALHPKHLRVYWNSFKNSKFAIAALVFFGAYLLSGFWSEDKSNWLALVQIKLPFLFFPFAMFSLPLKNIKWLKLAIDGLLLSLLGGMCYSFYFLIANPQSYSGGNHMPSPMEGDYIRFTIVIVLAMLYVVFFLKNRKPLSLSRISVGFLLFWMTVAIAYIHIQAAKSGLVAFCIFAVIFILDYGFKRAKFVNMFLLLGLLLVGEIAFSKLPAMSKQINNVSVEQNAMTTNDTAVAHKASSFIPRVNSYKVSINIIKGNPIIGVGAGDMKNEMDKLYARWFPGLPTVAYILPHNEFLCSAMAIGIVLSLLTLVPLIFLPLFRTDNRRNVYFLTTWIIIFFGLMIEPMLEVQFGIFVFLFFIYLWTEIPVEQPEPQGSN